MKLHYSNDGFDPYNPQKQQNDKHWIGAAIGAAASLASNAVNFFSQKKANDANAEFAQEQFDYQKQLNELTMQRQDSAFQRAVADAQKAGLSPLVATGSPAQSGGVNSTSLSLGQQAPQIEANTFGDMIRVLSSEAMQKRQLSNENASREDSQSHEQMMQAARLDAANATLQKQLEHESNESTKAQILDMIKFNRQQQFMIDSKNADYLAQMSQESMQSAKQQGIYKFRDFDNVEDMRAHNDSVLDEAQRAFDAEYAKAMQENQGYDNIELSENQENSGNLNAGFEGVLGAGTGMKKGAVVKGQRSAFERANAARLKVLNARGYAVYVPRVGKKYSGMFGGSLNMSKREDIPYKHAERQRDR